MQNLINSCKLYAFFTFFFKLLKAGVCHFALVPKYSTAAYYTQCRADVFAWCNVSVAMCDRG